MQSYNCTTTNSLKVRLALAFAAIAAVLLACTICVPQALAKQTVVMPDDWGVADDITRIHVNKLDAGTHEYVLGAKMAIYNRDTGELIDEWVTDGTTHKLEKVLDVNVVYILREEEAPEGYDTVEDVVFYVDAEEGVGLNILSWDEERSELTNGYTVSLYDQHADIVKTKPADDRTRSATPKTGDMISLALIGGLVVVAAVATVVVLLSRRRMKK